MIGDSLSFSSQPLLSDGEPWSCREDQGRREAVATQLHLAGEGQSAGPQDAHFSQAKSFRGGSTIGIYYPDDSGISIALLDVSGSPRIQKQPH